VAQLARYAVDQHFPVLVLNDETFDDFTFTTRLKITGGALAQMAGVVFRYQDPKNYYVLVASVLDKHFWFFKIVDGVRSQKLIGPSIEIAKDEVERRRVEAGITVSPDGYRPRWRQHSLRLAEEGRGIEPMKSLGGSDEIDRSPRDATRFGPRQPVFDTFVRFRSRELRFARIGGDDAIEVARQSNRRLTIARAAIERETVASG
jgi:hypothetical protein